MTATTTASMDHISISEHFKVLDNGHRQCLHCENKTYRTSDDEVLSKHILARHPAIINTPASLLFLFRPFLLHGHSWIVSSI
ncbi:hypothetical protein BC936DRAFT_140521 [Jimgerdemannia flammicorona]|uniref:Uncharacterized protein n=1 Tax=Jimgerdemannia flammicorona TaxID=994334 RepID=A0A433AR76_9FUNG|nr:hypothetical protein BC936DRAFT_140521 [Jimgerdemannia flammicorona]